MVFKNYVKVGIDIEIDKAFNAYKDEKKKEQEDARMAHADEITKNQRREKQESTKRRFLGNLEAAQLDITITMTKWANIFQDPKFIMFSSYLGNPTLCIDPLSKPNSSLSWESCMSQYLKIQ